MGVAISTDLLEEIFSIGCEVWRDTQLGVKDSVYRSLPVLGTERRLREGGEDKLLNQQGCGRQSDSPLP